MTAKYTVGQKVKYWGKRQALQGVEMTIDYVVACGCKHQTYGVKYVLADGTEGELSPVLEDSLRPA